MVHDELVGASDVGHSVRHHHGMLHVGIRVVDETDVVLEEPTVVMVQTHDELVDARRGGSGRAVQSVGDFASQNGSEERSQGLRRVVVRSQVAKDQAEKRGVVQLVEEEADLAGSGEIGLGERGEEGVHCEEAIERKAHGCGSRAGEAGIGTRRTSRSAPREGGGRASRGWLRCREGSCMSKRDREACGPLR